MKELNAKFITGCEKNIMKELNAEFITGCAKNIIMKNLDVEFIAGCGKIIIQKIQSDTVEKLRLEGMFHVSEN